MERKICRAALKKAILTAGFMLAAFEAVAVLTLLISDLRHYLILDIRNPVHHLILIAAALTIGIYTYIRVYMQEKAEQQQTDEPEDEEE